MRADSAAFFLCAAAAVFALDNGNVALASPCDMTKLAPILNGSQWKTCSDDANIEIPTASYFGGGDGLQLLFLAKLICTSPSCGQAIAAIKALPLGECQLAVQRCTKGGCMDVQVNLKSQHLDVLDALCGSEYNTAGTPPPMDKASFDATTKCTEHGLRSALYEAEAVVGDCLNSGLSSVVSQDCLGVSQQLPSGTSFGKQITEVITTCEEEAPKPLEAPASVVRDHVLNASELCSSQLLQEYLAPIQNYTRSCTFLLIDPQEKFSEDLKPGVCSACPDTTQGLELVDIPTCQLPFNMSYDAYVQDMFSVCAPQFRVKYADANADTLVSAANANGSSGSSAGNATITTPNAAAAAMGAMDRWRLVGVSVMGIVLVLLCCGSL